MENCVKKLLFISSFLFLFSCGGGGGSGGSSTQSSQGNSVANSSIGNSLAGSSASSSVLSGLSARPQNATCIAPAPVNSGTPTSISWQAVFPSLPNISNATNLLQAPGDNNYWYATRQPGRVVRFQNNATANALTEILNIEDRVDFSGGETGLLGMAFHPQFETNRYVYFNYIGRNVNNNMETRVTRFEVANNGIINRDSEIILLRFNQPYSNHNGGQIAFGSDGYLYISSGDGGSGGDPQQNGQNTNNLLGKILRIDVNNASGGRNYAIPADNPFAVTGGAPEIWAYGLRNPWRFGFDRETNELWVGDVGQGAWEEVNLVTRGGNYGWGDMEGDFCYSERTNCSTANKIKPVLSISHNTGVCSVIGGYVYRGTQYPAAYGKYFFTDFCVNTMQSITRNSNGNISVNSHGNVPVDIVSFAQDNQGELYAIGQSGAGSQIVKMQATGGQLQPGTMAARLSATGCVNSANPTLPAAAMIPYTVASPLWSDAAEKDRYFSLPNNTKIELTTDGDFLFPVGTVLMKHFTLNERFVETRLFARGELGWQGFSYEWRDDQTDALLLTDAKEKSIEGVQWQYPSRGQCLTCHTQVANFSLGLETLQLNNFMLYNASGINAHQLDTLAHINLFSSAITPTQKAQTLFSLGDTNATLTQRARSYLHSNCSNCHSPNGPTPVTLDLRYSTELAATQTCNVQPAAGDLGINNARIIAPGEPERSVLLARMKVRDVNQMPPLASHVVDQEAVNVIAAWIGGLENCN
ncbi:PQQ-dependent sugar dehydrogenase [Cellvibrio fibrivorans]|uniref:Repeat protein (TIGR03806 family) n=1 Tax=Cellvibrio fibrivorans TaxID=126350 RepID=A0ABU1V0Y4_9GAMM|nr:PQQ-dependent sugar dehydrogenase [Cellvibrio fibrivorans]MDR7091095.1 putative repeat protein (TIGR03806 family) [Cellvibrio fibrivorans]